MLASGFNRWAEGPRKPPRFSSRRISRHSRGGTSPFFGYRCLQAVGQSVRSLPVSRNNPGALPQRDSGIDGTMRRPVAAVEARRSQSLGVADDVALMDGAEEKRGCPIRGWYHPRNLCGFPSVRILNGPRVTSLPSPPFRAVPGNSQPRFANCGRPEGVHSAASRTTSISKVPPSLLRMIFGSGPRAASSRIRGVSMPRRSSGPSIVLRC